MDEKLKQILNVLLELRNASINTTANNISETMHKYNMLFVGEKFNCIYSMELSNTLKQYFNIEITIDDLNHLIPVACKTLEMNFEPMILASDAGKTDAKIACYAITLW